MTPPAAPALELVVGASSSELRRHIGPNAWVVLEELLLGATLNEPAVGQAMSRATVRALATRTGLSKDTISRSLHKLRAAKVVAVEAERQDDSGRFVSVRYVVDLRHVPIGVRTCAAPAAPASPIPPATSRRVTTSSPPLVPQRPEVIEQLSMLGD